MVNRSTSGFVVTDEWLIQWRTFAGAWTKAQFNALGLKFSPKHGWKLKVIGQTITNEAKKAFEDGRDKRVVLDAKNPLHRKILERREREWNQPL